VYAVHHKSLPYAIHTSKTKFENRIGSQKISDKLAEQTPMGAGKYINVEEGSGH